VFRGSTDVVHSHHFAIHRHHDWKLWTIARTVCKPGDTIVEIGANVGTETIGFADIVGPRGRVIAFEPVPKNVELLRRAVGAQAHVQIVDRAISDRAGRMEFVLPPEGGWTGVGHLGRAVDTEKTLEVDVTTIDTFFAADQRAAFVAIDAEGAETQILRGGRAWIARHRPVVALESNHGHLRRAGSSRRELLELLGELGYVVHAIDRIGLSQPSDSPLAPPLNWLAIDRSAYDVVRAVSRALTTRALMPLMMRSTV
jgi:FkbM family methyltransferase